MVKANTLDGLTKAVEKAAKVIQLKDLDPNYDLVVVTENETEYDIIVLEPQAGLVRVKGGPFTDPTECKLNGSTMGDFMLWMGRIVIGMCMEFFHKGTIVTSPVKIIGWRVDSMAPISNTVH